MGMDGLDDISGKSRNHLRGLPGHGTADGERRGHPVA